jgi:probable rRNA maturation factor
MSKKVNFTLINPRKAKLPRLAFRSMKDAVLGEGYMLNLVIVDKKEIERLNREYRGKNTPTDILSFPLSRDEGEMYINIEEAKKEAKKFGRSFPNFFAFLFIHGLVHLKGHTHGSTMERLEKKYRGQFGI